MQGDFGMKTAVKPDPGDPVHLHHYVTVRYPCLDDIPGLDGL